MENQPTRQRGERVIPLVIVFMAIGFILVLTVGAIWIVTPSKMPQPLYEIMEPYLQQAPMPVPLAVIEPTDVSPTAIPDTVNLLPETPLEETEDELPDYFVSALDATTIEPEPGQPQRLIIPSINMDADITAVGLQAIQQNNQTYYQWQVPKTNKAGWHNSSALLGQAGNTVLNGHHNIHGEIFRNLIDLQEGDEIIMQDATEQTYTYRITFKDVLEERGQPIDVRLQNAQWIEPTDDERITLITCWPYTDNSHRVVVVAEPVSASE